MERKTGFASACTPVGGEPGGRRTRRGVAAFPFFDGKSYRTEIRELVCDSRLPRRGSSPPCEDLKVKESIGQRLRRLRQERGLSQRELSEPGISYAYVSRIEAGVRNPSEKALRALAPKLGVTPLTQEAA